MATPGAQGWRRHVGSRIVVRVRTPSGHLRDVLGDLLHVGDGRLRVRTRTGEQEVDLADVVAGKPVPPPPVRPAPPHRALTALALETVMAEHWRAPDTGHLGRWLLRAAGGFTNRANSVLPLGEPDRPVADAVDAVARWYDARGQEPRAAMPTPRPDDPDRAPLTAAAEAFAAAGWTPLAGAGAHVLTAPTAELRSAGAAIPTGAAGRWQVHLLDEPDAAWLERYHYRGQPLGSCGLALLTSAPQQAFAAVRDGAGTVAIGRGSVASAWAGITAVEVDPGYRRQGLARLVMSALATWGWRRGAWATFVQVGETNDAARALYLSSGFAMHHTYAYLAPAGRS